MKIEIDNSVRVDESSKQLKLGNVMCDNLNLH